MRRAWPFLIVVAAALPAWSDRAVVTQNNANPGRTGSLTARALDALTPVDTTPDMTALDNLFGSGAMESLMTAATDPASDIGAAIRATRALPAYCANQLDLAATAPCGPGTQPHDTIASIVVTYQADRTPAGLVKLRAGIEALGLTRSADSTDASLLLPLAQHDSRDIRAAAATALGNLCDGTQAPFLHQREFLDSSAQVQAALALAIRKLQSCGAGGP